MSANTPSETDERIADSETSEAGSSGTGASHPELRAQLELLEAENRRLRAEYAQARRSQYRRTAIGLAVIGAVAILGGIAFPASNTVLFSLGAIGFFAAILTYYLTPERFVGPLADAPATLADQLADGVVESFELADGIDPELSSDGTQCTFGIVGSALGDVDRFDHPAVSFLAFGLAVGLDRTVETTVTSGDDRFEHRIVCSWTASSPGGGVGG